MKTLRIQRYLYVLLFVCFLLTMLVGIGFITDTPIFGVLFNTRHLPAKSNLNVKMDSTSNEKTYAEFKLKEDGGSVNIQVNDKDDATPLRSSEEAISSDGFPRPNYDVHAFYYPWYGNPEHDSSYYHWNHRYLAHWDKQEAARWPTGRHRPPDDVGANFYPELGAYSSKDPAVIEDHMKQLRVAGIGTIAVSWYPPGQADDEGQPPDDVIPALLDLARKYQIKVCFHIEPFKDRSAKTFRETIQYIAGTYGDHPALYRRAHRGRDLPLYYVYDSYQVNSAEWQSVLGASAGGGQHNVRGGPLDGIFIGLLVEARHRRELLQAGFDGFYTYFASDGFSYGSRRSNWRHLAVQAAGDGALFIPSVGPGYIDERVRPWNARNTKSREGGKYYEGSWRAALGTGPAPAIVSITSFNEWGEGSQIEPAVPKQTADFTYLDYGPQSPDFYLTLTRKWAHKFGNLRRNLSN